VFASVLKDDEVVVAVVAPITIDVMNDGTGREFPAQCFLCDTDVAPFLLN
jgi:hypothetical protein